jgi:hypothetical protein
MKAFSQIQLEILFIEENLRGIKEKYSNLHQIDMLSAEGSNLLEEIHKMEGKIIALKWVINDRIIGDLHE